VEIVMALRFIAFTTAVVVSNCGGGSSDPDEGPTFAEVSDAFDALSTTIDALPPTLTMPAGGSASYAGLARIDYGFGGAQRVMVGEAALIADFGSGTASGTLSRFVDQREGAVDGRISMTGGTISGRNIDGLAVSGDLGVGDETLAFRGTGSGQFKGVDAPAVRLEMGGAAGGAAEPGWSGAAYLER
jgi:hypothetical protein